jgi:hypothetical protein
MFNKMKQAAFNTWDAARVAWHVTAGLCDAALIILGKPRISRVPRALRHPDLASC